MIIYNQRINDKMPKKIGKSIVKKLPKSAQKKAKKLSLKHSVKAEKKLNKAVGKKGAKTLKDLAHRAKKEDWHQDIGVAAKQSQKIGQGLMFASSVAAAAGAPEAAVPLSAAGGGALAASKGLHEVHKSKVLKKKPRRKVETK